jgi:hypothetical protein
MSALRHVRRSQPEPCSDPYPHPRASGDPGWGDYVAKNLGVRQLAGLSVLD